jgi:hypothetical protein
MVIFHFHVAYVTWKWNMNVRHMDFGLNSKLPLTTMAGPLPYLVLATTEIH